MVDLDVSEIVLGFFKICTGVLNFLEEFGSSFVRVYHFDSATQVDARLPQLSEDPLACCE